MVRAQIPFGRKSILETYGEVLFRAWKASEGELRREIEDGFLQGLVEGAIHARSRLLAASVRRVLGGFINQRTSDEVEKLIFRLVEPVLFRSLQVLVAVCAYGSFVFFIIYDRIVIRRPISNKCY